MSDLLVSIRQARAEDAEGLSKVFDAAWREAYSGIIPGVTLQKMLARRGTRWWRSTVSRGRPLAVLDLAHRADPKGHGREKWPRLSAPDDAPLQERGIGSIPKVESTFGSDAQGQGIAGYASYGRCRDRALPAKGEVDELYLLPEYQGLGFGRRLFRAVCNDLRHRGMSPVVVWALADNERACAFYEGMGGRSVARVEERIGGAPLAKIAYLFR